MLYTYPVTLVRVIDADTVVVDIDRGFNDMSQRTLRLAHLNAPEIRTAEGKAAKAYLVSILPTVRNAITLNTVKAGTDQDKYGRYLAVLLVDGVSVNEKLITSGHAVPYEGGTR